METFFSSVAGIDVHKDQITVSVIIGEHGENLLKETWESNTFTEDLENCGRKLISLGIKHVAMESSGIYWRPIYNVWEKMGIIITLGNATHIRNVPGRKTDVKDSQWIAELHSNGLIRPSYIPKEEFRELRSLTRHRRSLVEDIGRTKKRVQKILEDGNIKLSSVISDVFGVTGFKIVSALAKGITDPYVLAKEISTNIKASEKEVIRSLKNTLKGYQIVLLRELLTQYLYLSQLRDNIEKEIDIKMTPYNELVKRLDGIPGVDKISAEEIIAEATTKMGNFKSGKHFAAWAGVAPGNHESAGKKKRQNVDTGTQH